MTPFLAEPLVRYGVENKNIRGDPTGWYLKNCGNIAHWSDLERYTDFTRFDDADFDLRNDPQIAILKDYLSDIEKNGMQTARIQGRVVHDTTEQLVIHHEVCGMSVKIVQLRDASYSDKKSYSRAARAKKLEKQSVQRMDSIEGMIGRETQNFLMAKMMEAGQAPNMMMHGAKDEKPKRENRKGWYKLMRQQSVQTFWVNTAKKDRDAIRNAANKPPEELAAIMEQIRQEDKSHTLDYVWQHLRDGGAAKDPEIYEKVHEQVVVVLDQNSQVVLCKVTGLFQFLYDSMDKVEDAVRKWSSLPPLPIPNTQRHMVDLYIRQHEHPELDHEKARSLDELEERYNCVVHLGTWAMKGRHNPRDVHRTPDTLLNRGAPVKVQENYPAELFPEFRKKALGLGSEVVRYLLSTMAPAEYEKCCEIYNALPKKKRMKMSLPGFATLVVLGINSFTDRHADSTDVEFGFAGLVPLGNYTGGDICFPQLAMAIKYQRGDCIIFRGAELEHCVADWTGYRNFLLYTNHQPVRNYAHRLLRKLPPIETDPWHPDYVPGKMMKSETSPQSESDSDLKSGEIDLDLYDPCYTESAEQEPEDIYQVDLHGPYGWEGNPDSSKGSGDSSIDKGHLISNAYLDKL